MDNDVKNLILASLKEIQNDVKDIHLIEHELKRITEFIDNSPQFIVNTVKNNSDLADELNKRALEKTKAYLNTQEARDSLKKIIDEEIKKTKNKELLWFMLKLMGVFGTILTIVFSVMIKWYFQ